MQNTDLFDMLRLLQLDSWDFHQLLTPTSHKISKRTLRLVVIIIGTMEEKQQLFTKKP
jgi:hypothetical protein